MNYCTDCKRDFGSLEAYGTVSLKVTIAAA